MDIFYDVAIFNDQGVNTCRFSLGAVRSLLLNAPSDFELEGIAVNALNHITHEPIGDVTVLEIGTFFTVLCQLWAGLQTSNNPGLTLTHERRVQVAAVVCLPVIPDDVPLSKGNQYTYFRDCRHTKSLSDRWKATKAEYLAQNPHMSERGAQPRRIYEVRRQMAHDLGWVHKDSFHLFETPPRTSEEFLPEIPRPVWNMPFMCNPGMELPILPRFTGRKALPASSAPRPASLAELRHLNRPTVGRLEAVADHSDSATASSGTEPPVNSDLDSNAATAGSG